MPKSERTSLSVKAGESAVDGPRTVVCFGTARGGTSMVAGAILGLGVPMGEGLGRNLEDPEFNFDQLKLPMDEFLAHARKVIAARNNTHRIWGWKFPRAGHYLEDVIDDLRAPHLVCVYRDPVPMATRRLKDHEAATTFITERLRAQIRNTELVERLGVPCLMVSYEKASQKPLVFLSELAEFLNLPLPADVDDVAAFMAPGSYKDPDVLTDRLTPPG